MRLRFPPISPYLWRTIEYLKTWRHWCQIYNKMTSNRSHLTVRLTTGGQNMATVTSWNNPFEKDNSSFERDSFMRPFVSFLERNNLIRKMRRSITNFGDRSPLNFLKIYVCMSDGIDLSRDSSHGTLPQTGIALMIQFWEKSDIILETRINEWGQNKTGGCWGIKGYKGV